MKTSVSYRTEHVPSGLPSQHLSSMAISVSASLDQWKKRQLCHRYISAVYITFNSVNEIIKIIWYILFLLFSCSTCCSALSTVLNDLDITKSTFEGQFSDILMNFHMPHKGFFDMTSEFMLNHYGKRNWKCNLQWL